MNRTLPRLCIVEDEERIRAQLLLFLDDYDEFRVTAVESGEKALEMLRRDPADVCIVDLRLPGMNGATFIRSALKTGLCRRCLVHTGTADRVLLDELRSVGVSDRDVFLKPTKMNRILARIRDLLSGEND
ncbi:response regulator [Desulfonatronum thiodismutans]|uniref:response regulator n=1 Tax=Desulfonatronum thiodismutans TaxID=159290 RepID=UPI0004ABDFEB|nr:response regulator [Desulfonatronum thiodismutans]